MWMCVCLDSLPVVGLILCRRLTGSHGEELFNQFAPKHSFCSLSSLCCPLPSRLQRAWLEPGRWQQLIPCCPAAVLWTDPRNHSESPIPGISHSSYNACQSCLGKEVLRDSEELQVEADAEAEGGKVHFFILSFIHCCQTVENCHLLNVPPAKWSSAVVHLQIFFVFFF